MKIGILTLPIKTNYGGVLQAYALLTTLKKLGYDAWFIKRRWNSERQSWLHKKAKGVYHAFLIRKFNTFINRYIQPQTEVIDTETKAQSLLNRGFDGYVVGSDQVWRMKNVWGAGYNYFLDFTADLPVKRVAYAASFGVGYWDDAHPEYSIPIVKKLLLKFDGISVRENTGVTLCKDTFGVHAEHVLDPTLLLKKEDYIRNLHLKVTVSQPYIAVYILDMTDKKQAFLEKISVELAMPLRFISEGNSVWKKLLPYSMQELVKPSIPSWIESIANASYVITDSFHGTAFSIIFEKQFLSIGNVARGLDRFLSILQVLNLENRLLCDLNVVPSINEINYQEVNEKLAEQREHSINFIKSNIHV